MTLTPDAGKLRGNLELIGRDEINDFGAIMSVVGSEEPDGAHRVTDRCEATFTWDYAKGRRAKLDKLYEKAKTAQWNAQTDLPWDTPVDPEALAATALATNPVSRLSGADLGGTVLEKWTEQDWITFNVENQNWMLSQFMHGEQGALLCTAKIVETVPWVDAKYYAATQVMDEARHMEVFSRYLDDKLTGHYPMNGHLKALIDDILADARWDITYLGMQIMVEGLALAAFGFLQHLTQEPLLKQLLRYVMADEARHVAFGVLSLQELYTELSARELRERQEFAFEAAVRMRDRMQLQEVWERLGVPSKDVVGVLARAPERAEFQILLFSRIIPNCRKLGLLDAADGWLRKKFSEMGVIEFEHLADSTEEADAMAEGSPAERLAS